MNAEHRLVLDCCARFGDPDGLEDYLALYAPDALLWGYGPGPLQGKDAIRAFYEGVKAAFVDIDLVLDEVLEAEGGRLVLRFHMDGTHAGPFLGVPPTGRRVTLPGLTVLRFEGGLCVERWSTADFLGLLVQLGAFGAGTAASA